MLWFANKVSEDLSPKSTSKNPSMLRKSLRIAFNPEIGASIRPIKETTDVFIQLLAMVFITLKMFPANHPSFSGSNGQRLTMSLLLSETWNNLKLSKETVPQFLVFFAVVSSFFFAAIAFVLFMLSMLVHKAHAAGYYTSEASADIAQSWIDFLFKGGDLAGAGGWPFNTAAPIAASMISALAFYSDAILIVAAVILFYHLAAMTVETAHEGVVMGKRANQIWAPIRLVVAIGLLVPIGGGLNSGQYIVIRMTEWGSALASNVWEIFLGGFAESASMEGAAFAPELARNLVTNALLTAACKEAYNAYDKKSEKNAPGTGSAVTPNSGNRGGATVRDNAQKGKQNVNNNRRCGGEAFAAPTNSSSPNGQATGAAAAANAQSCYDQLQQEVGQYAKERVKDHTGSDVGGTGDTKPPQPYAGELEDFFSDYMGCLTGGLPIPSLVWAFGESAAFGWVSAGALVSAISQAEADANNIGSMIPSTQSASGDGATDPNMQQAMKVAGKVSQQTQAVPEGGGGGGGGFGHLDACDAQRAQIIQQIQGLDIMGNAKDHLLERIFQFIDLVAGWNCVYKSAGMMGEGGLTPSSFSVGIQFDTGANPLAEMAHLGHANINTAYDVFDLYINEMASVGEGIATGTTAAGVSGNSKASAVMGMKAEGAKGALQAVGAILVMIINIFFVTGVMLAYYVPMIPFMQFLFQTLSWVIGVLEAVIAVPLIALAHLTVEGQGLPGSMAKAAYFFVFNIFLRPVLMIFGLVVGLLTLYIAVSYMNLFYEMAISSSGGAATSELFLSRLVWSALYVIIIYICANNVFRAIGWLPEHAVKWMGAQSMSFMHTGDAKDAAGPLQQGAGNISQITGAVQSNGWGGAKALGGNGGIGGSKQVKGPKK